MVFLTEGGLDTTPIFLEGFDLPSFAPYDLSNERKGFKAIKNYFNEYLQFAMDHHMGFIMESPTWRANRYWIQKMGYPDSAINDINEKAIDLMLELREGFRDGITSVPLGGCIGPCGEGYVKEQVMTVGEAEKYHEDQIGIFSERHVDFISARAINYVQEALGIVRAGNVVNIPVVICFSLEIDGKLPSGMNLQEAISLIDNGVKGPPIYYMVNCAHPSHFLADIPAGSRSNKPWIKRIRGIRSNTTLQNHFESEGGKDCVMEDSIALAQAYGNLKNHFKHLNIFGSYCGTDKQHLMTIIGALGFH
jgi:S-methylmethionine-dependent homocysteine/selenocysteine methylase